MRTVLTATLLVLCFIGLAGRPAAARQQAPVPHKLVLEEFFRGPLVAEGEFVNSRDNTRREVKVRMHGSWDGSVLTLVEDFVFSDGEKDRKTWRFTRTGEGRYLGTREDVIGQALVTQDGNDVLLAYTATVRTKSGGSYPIRFADRLTLTGPRQVLNTAALSYLFFDVGQVHLTIRRLRR
jgi:hypothetical protein